MAFASHFISYPAVFGFALIYGFSIRHLSVCNLSQEQQVTGGCTMTHSLYTELLHVIFIACNVVEQPRVHAEYIHMYTGVKNSKPRRLSLQKKVFLRQDTPFLAN